MTRNDNITKKEIKDLLELVSDLISDEKYKILIDRPKNQFFMSKYKFYQDEMTQVISDLTCEHFCKRDFNRNSKFPLDEYVYIFSTDIELSEFNKVPVYIKFTIKNSLVVISFHELEYPIEFYFDSSVK